MKDAQQMFAPMKHIYRKLYSMLFILAVLGQAGCASLHRAANPYEPIVVFSQATTLIEKNYIDKTGNKVKLDTSMQPDVSTLIAQLDSSAALYSPEDIQVQKNPSGGAIGVGVELKDGFYVVTVTLPLSPARKAGLHKEDKIIEIDGAPIADLSRSGVFRLLQGAPGTEVSVKIVTRSGDEKLLRITRAALEIPETAAGRLVEKNIGYLRIERFWPHTLADVKGVMKRLDRDGIRGLVIDLRNNWGGMMTSITGVSQLFMKRAEVIVTFGGRSDGQENEFKAWKWFPYTDFPVVVLIDGQTASGAEVIAAALRDNNRALLVGEKSAGRCDIRTAYPLRDGSQLYLRTALARTPAGALVDGQGVKPDKEVVVPKEERNELYDRMESFPELGYVDSPADVQLKAAIAVLRENNIK